MGTESRGDIMTVTMGWGDIWINLLVGIVASASFAAVMRYGKRVIIFASDKWSQRSRRATEAAIQSIEEQVKSYEEINQNTQEFTGNLIWHATMSCFYLIFGVFWYT
jgi:hypothetical protein